MPIALVSLPAVFATAFLVTRWQREDAAPEPPPSAAIHQISVSAEFGDRAPGHNNTNVDAKYDTGFTFATAHARAPVDSAETLFYDAFPENHADVRLHVDDKLTTATLWARLVVKSCRNAAGDDVRAGCPVGRVVRLEGSWSDAKSLESWRNAGQHEVNLMRGRLATSRMALDGRALGNSAYAEIVENRVTPLQAGQPADG